LDVSSGKLAGFFSCDFEICGAAFEAHGCEDGASRDVPWSIGLDQGKIGIFVDGCNPADETGLIFRWFWSGCFGGLIGTG
jgi:hypothetical protein